MPIPTRAASKSGSARRLYVRRHGVVTTPAITCSDPNGSPLVGMASRHGFPVGQHPNHRSSTGGRSRRLPASRRDGHGRRTGDRGMRRVEPFRTARFPGGDFSGLRSCRTFLSPWEESPKSGDIQICDDVVVPPAPGGNQIHIKLPGIPRLPILKPTHPYRPRPTPRCRCETATPPSNICTRPTMIPGCQPVK